MKAISKINNTLAKIEGAVMVFWFAIVLVVMTCQVVSRYIFNAPIAWSEEFARYSFVWISYIEMCIRDRIYAEPVDKVFAQGAMAAVANILTAVIVGALLIAAYTKTIAKKGSLEKQ